MIWEKHLSSTAYIRDSGKSIQQWGFYLTSAYGVTWLFNHGQVEVGLWFRHKNRFLFYKNPITAQAANRKYWSRERCNPIHLSSHKPSSEAGQMADIPARKETQREGICTSIRPSFCCPPCSTFCLVNPYANHNQPVSPSTHPLQKNSFYRTRL